MKSTQGMLSGNPAILGENKTETRLAKADRCMQRLCIYIQDAPSAGWDSLMEITARGRRGEGGRVKLKGGVEWSHVPHEVTPKDIIII